MPISTQQHEPNGQNDDQSYKIKFYNVSKLSPEVELNEEFWMKSNLPHEHNKSMYCIQFKWHFYFLRKRKTTFSLLKRQLARQNIFEEKI